MVALVRAGAHDTILTPLRPVVIEPGNDAHPALWRQAWIAWQEVRGFGADLISPPDHYRPNPYWSPPQIRLWAYNRAALLLVADGDGDRGGDYDRSPAGDTTTTDANRSETDLILRFLGIRRTHGNTR